jgi:single-strand DNA-binding protein
MNKIILLGNVGKDPETRTLENGTKVTSLTIATSETWKDKQGNKKEEVQWHSVQLWRGLAEVAETYVKKGSKLLIEGKVTYRSYEDKEGNTKYITEIVGKEMKMLGGKQQEQGSKPVKEDLPF